MLNPARQLTELVRLLQERVYIFAADPELITEALRHAAGGHEAKLNRRAELIDSNHKLQDSLNHVRQLFGWLLWAATFFWLASGFIGTFTLMQQSGLNFFLVLTSVLGLHTLMLLLWLVWMALPRTKAVGWLMNPTWLMRGKDPVNQAILRLYNDERQRPEARWQLAKTSHWLWLSALSGMLVAAILLLSVRQYTFNWESTLLSDGVFVNAVNVLSWLPEKLGFPVPDKQSILNSRLNSDITSARQWGGLLVGSIVCYGMLPRFLVWLLCKQMARGTSTGLSLEQPYYQHIIQQWQQQVVDADIHSENIVVVTPKINLNDQAVKWAILFEGAWLDSAWFKHVLGQDWLDKGVADSRDKVAALKAELQQHSVQLLIGVRAHAVPDRGMLRQITMLADAAQGGAVVQLLADEQFVGSQNDYLNQWHDALLERQLAWLDPPHFSQRQRLKNQLEKEHTADSGSL